MESTISKEAMKIFYSRDERRQLLELLSAGSQSSQRRKVRHLATTSRPVASADEVRVGLVNELDCAARDTFTEFSELRNGELDRRISMLKALPRLLNDLEAQVRELRPVLEHHGSGLNEDAQSLLDRVHSAARLYDLHHGTTPGNIKSEGESDSRNLANACLDRFLIFVCVIWFQGTAEKIRISKWLGPFARFVVAAVKPFVREINRDRAGLVSAAWVSLAQRIVRLEVQKSDLLTPIFERRPAIKLKTLQALASNRPR
jgi:hypothetical protein